MADVIVPLESVGVSESVLTTPPNLAARSRTLRTNGSGGFLPGEGRLHPGGQEGLPGLRGPHGVLEYALEHDERFGIWGGLSERERRRMKREAV